MNDKELKLFAFQPKTGFAQLSFFVMALNEKEALSAVENFIKETFGSTCSAPYAGFGTDAYEMTVLKRGEVIDNAND